jgi:hypothetical protein
MTEPGDERRVLLIETSAEVIEWLEALLATGLYGKNIAEVAEELMRRTLREELYQKEVRK